MQLDLKTIEALAPDQASLAAAAKLTKRSNWPRLETNEQLGLVWGECQGSGSNPYRVVFDLRDHGNKCTCPSRKFPCKHILALAWIGATAPASFDRVDQTPEWVNDWLGRRRKPSPQPTQTAADSQVKSIDEASRPEQSDPVEDAAAAERREAAQRKRAEDTRSAVSAALDELDQWIADQLRLGLAGFVEACSERCRRIAARLVDLKATALAGRIDELPARLMTLRSEERPDAAIRELGKLVLLAKAWRAAPDDAELKRLVSTSETREQILANPDAVQVESDWEVLGEKIETRRDGLVSHATWLLDLQSPTPRFAVLLDFFPASAGRRSGAFAPGDRFKARLVFYPSRNPLRALVAERLGDVTSGAAWPVFSQGAAGDPLQAYSTFQDNAPWLSECPVILPAGAILTDERDGVWWQAGSGPSAIALPVEGTVNHTLLGIELTATAALWNGARLELLASQSNIGRLDLS
ncbi:SWIM zinc finger family protein [Mesorhizobium sp. M3A.F.Ca.ET.080.04.2.1]|nr:SWIM zinc finger family protein [Mesorhizobium sp. M3A.F.Ca.ET.080.04.2.1]AZO09347.1 SWIM zinc finger family protein [Mesorhizobium sp. M3A.F.Ca.ET.080.04.2.1]RWB67197.1 MAG: SWIM zinc finger family protein [Mesorhizobium sp.]RWB87811.1 MAG: SWIM zinc finger family protein [Mesorhizobium sp.]RWE29732.1 MAG: SWIM zinc finger family protein [Mesorhizobium sp.]